MCPDRHIVSDEGSFWCELEAAAKALTLTDDTQSALRLRRLVEAFIREDNNLADEPSACQMSIRFTTVYRKPM